MGYIVIYDLLYYRYGMEQSEVQSMMTIIAAPWAPKIFYGIIIDTFPICGSTKKNYLIVLGTLFSVSSFIAGLFDFETAGPLIFLITLSMVASAMMDVVVDGLMVSQSRLDPKSGSEDLQSFMWGVAGLAGMVGYVGGGILSQNGWSRESFYIGATIAILINISACFLDKKLEEGVKNIVKMGLCERTKHNFKMVW